jgi:hypothetical protein
MKLKFLLLLLLFSSCQSHMSGLSSAISDSLKNRSNPTLLALQFLTVELKRSQAHWPDNTTAYAQVYDDSATVLFSEFKTLEFRQQNDTLQILYTLKDPRKITNYDIEFVDAQLYTDNAKTTFESESQNTNTGKSFRKSQGRMSFVERENYFLVMHEYAGGRSKNKITFSQP